MIDVPGWGPGSVGMISEEAYSNPETILNPEGLYEFWATIRADLTDFLERLSDGDFTRPADSGWNAAEIADHIYLSQWNFARTIPIIAKGKAGEDTSIMEPVRYGLITKGFNRPRGVKNPDNLSPTEPPNRETTLANLARALDKLKKSLDGRTDDELRNRGSRHPYFGLLPLGVFVWTMALHERMHFNALRAKLEA